MSPIASRVFPALLFLAALLASGAVSRAQSVNIGLTIVGDPGNPPDAANVKTVPNIGNVPYFYQIGTHDVTLNEYAAFLRAVASHTDPYHLYNSGLAYTNTNAAIMRASIVQTSTMARFTYTVKGNGRDPVTFVNWFDAARFCNWLHNDQPVGLGEVDGSTETGAYSLEGDVTSGLEIRNPGAAWWIPSENEWYKAAYYDPTRTGSSPYWMYPAQRNVAPGNDYFDATIPNQANCIVDGTYSVTQSMRFASWRNYLTPVGAFKRSASYYGTFDQGGDVWQWNDALFNTTGANISRGERGGSWSDVVATLSSATRGSSSPTSVGNSVGFRVAAAYSVKAGAYRGLLGDAGILVVDVGRTGSFIGEVLLDGSSESFSGFLRTPGGFSGEIGRARLPVSMDIVQDAAGDYLLTGSAGGLAFTADHAAYERGQRAAETGNYTILFSSTNASAAVPYGTGYGVLSVAETGGYIMAGKLADGERFSTSGIVIRGTGGNELLIYKELTYRSVTARGMQGLLIGSLTFEKLTGSVLDGTLEWMKPGQDKGDYPAPFATNLEVVGSRYKDAGGGGALPGFSTGVLELSDLGALSLTGSSQIETPVTLTAENALRVTVPNADNIRIRLRPGSGFFSGSFTYPGQTKPVDFGGTLFQDQTIGAGFFLGPSGSGTVSISSQ